MNVTPILKKLGIDPTMSVHRAIHEVGIIVNEAPNRLQEANKILVSFGAPKVQREDRIAEVLAKGLIEQAVLNPTKFVLEDAMKIANEKYENILSLYPYTLKSTEAKQEAKRKAPRKNNDKKARALEICEENKTLSNAELAKLIAEELDITFANAYYYASRVFKRDA